MFVAMAPPCVPLLQWLMRTEVSVLMQELEDCITKTWNLVKHHSDSKALYTSKTSGGKPYNYLFRKMLIRKINDVSLMCLQHCVYMFVVSYSYDVQP